jgi:hypothetical protein
MYDLLNDNGMEINCHNQITQKIDSDVNTWSSLLRHFYSKYTKSFLFLILLQFILIIP